METDRNPRPPKRRPESAGRGDDVSWERHAQLADVAQTKREYSGRGERGLALDGGRRPVPPSENLSTLGGSFVGANVPTGSADASHAATAATVAEVEDVLQAQRQERPPPEQPLPPSSGAVDPLACQILLGILNLPGPRLQHS